MNRREFVTGSLAAAALLQAREAASSQSAASSPAQANGVRVLVFDTFGTVVDWRGSVIAELEKLGKARNLNVDWAAFADAWRGGYGPSMNLVRSGKLPWTKLDALHRMVLDQLIEKFQINGLSEEEKKHLNYVWHRLKPWPDSVQGLTRLKKKFVIAPLSNGNVSLLTNMAKQAGLPWDAILSTEIVKHYKPDRETYLMAPEFWDVEPSAVMMVAAHAGDLDAAKKLGLKTAFVYRPLEFGPARQPAKPADGSYDFMARDFRELASQLGT
jgi:2-haloacid dehalogenase